MDDNNDDNFGKNDFGNPIHIEPLTIHSDMDEIVGLTDEFIKDNVLSNPISTKTYISHFQITKTQLFDPYSDIRKDNTTSLKYHCVLSIPEKYLSIGCFGAIRHTSTKVNLPIVADTVVGLRDNDLEILELILYCSDKVHNNIPSIDSIKVISDTEYPEIQETMAELVTIMATYFVVYP